MDSPVIRLWELEELALVVECSSGVIYSNQAGGNYCLQPEAEGVLVPLGVGCDIVERLGAFFEDPRVPPGGLMPIHADALDAILRTPVGQRVVTPTFFLEVDRTRLADSMEAWLYVTITTCPDVASFRELNANLRPDLPLKPSMYPCAGFSGRSGVLTWANSD